MKLKYADQLTGYELCILYLTIIKQYGGFKSNPIRAYRKDFTIIFDSSYYVLDDDNAETLLDGNFEIDDYGVLSNDCKFGYNIELTKILREFMLNKFGKQYMEDCFWNDFGDESGGVY